jgi:hypothetical protein
MEQFVFVVSAVPEVESVTVAVKLKVPAAIGVPVIEPVPELSVNPEGSAPVVIEKV